jgi:hypothetical protein
LNTHQYIINGIKEQLFLNDYLVLPGFGGFVLKTQSSHFSVSGQTLMPPCKTVGFNIQLKQDDGILTNWLQDKLVCSKQDAKQHLRDFAGYCSSVLQSKRRLALAGIGFFYLDFEDNVCFEPDHAANFFTQSFGLSGLSIKPIVLEEKSGILKEQTFVAEDRSLANSINNIQQPKRVIRYRKTAYLAVFITFLSTFLIFIVNNLNVNGVLNSSLFSASSKSVYSPILYPELQIKSIESETKSFVADNNGIANFLISKDKSIAVNIFDNNSKSDNSNLGSKKSKYEIILGCFKKMKNAKHLLASLKSQNIQASIKENSYKGMHVVSVLGINDKIEAIDQLEKIQNQYPKAWMKVN